MGSTRKKYRDRRELVPQGREEGAGAERDASEGSWRREGPRSKERLHRTDKA